MPPKDTDDEGKENSAGDDTPAPNLEHGRRSARIASKLTAMVSGAAVTSALLSALYGAVPFEVAVAASAAALAVASAAGATIQLQRERTNAQSEHSNSLRRTLQRLASTFAAGAASASPTAAATDLTDEIWRRWLRAAEREPEKKATEAVAELDPAAGARLQVAARLRSRARANRYFSLLSIGGIAAAVVLAFILFSRVDDLVESVSHFTEQGSTDVGSETARVTPDEGSGGADTDDTDDTTEEASGATDATAVIALYLTSRVGVLLLIIFGVQILHGVFRYMQRIAAFYDARADALELATSNKEFSEIVGALAPDVEFGNAPKSPTEHLAKLVSDALNREKKDSSQTSA